MAGDIENHTLRLLQDMRAEMRQGFGRVDERLVSLEGRIQSLDGRMESLEGRMGSLEGRMGSLEGRIQSLDGRMESLEGRMGSLEGRMEPFEERLLTVEGSLTKVIDAVTGIANVQEKQSVLLIELVESGRATGSRLTAVEARLARIEKHTGLANA